MLAWLWYAGKSPDEAKGYSESVIENTAYRLSKIYRWVWNREPRQETVETLSTGCDGAQREMEELATEPVFQTGLDSRRPVGI